MDFAYNLQPLKPPPVAFIVIIVISAAPKTFSFMFNFLQIKLFSLLALETISSHYE